MLRRIEPGRSRLYWSIWSDQCVHDHVTVLWGAAINVSPNPRQNDVRLFLLGQFFLQENDAAKSLRGKGGLKG